MSILDPQMFPAFYLDPATHALLTASAQTSSKMSSSFLISDIMRTPTTTTTNQETAESGNSVSPCSPRPSSPSTERSLTESPHMNGSKKSRKARTIFTDKQLQELEQTFERQKYLSVQDRMELAQRMGLSDTQVKTWYQNRRTKWKRQSTTGSDLLSDPTNLAAVQNLIRTNPYWSAYLPHMNPLLMGMPFPLMNLNQLPTNPTTEVEETKVDVTD